ncbi:mitochondrial ribosomal protein L28-domain-containing protein [Halteromyces radiatus]|uniref:mitochondrial ribosomal protein L28-domain-containing protein n=1 Tax=Halteromyces radiatus TaxID=101107 RepID=UPI002220BB0B|nr:mitochondrial ribosomal protein L28-domain-containing protein [Halteromyces radiatus]KAI8098937.1 mitochondrial ribosomal protein L28-domain-containing protein [Halteromyces radiatus]
MFTLIRQQTTQSIYTKQVVRLVSTQSGNTSHSSGDNRLEVIRRVLFESPQRPSIVSLEGEALQQHDTIERAWKLHTMRERERKQRTLEKQFRSLHQAMSELEKTSDRLFKGAIVKSRHITYPKQAKIPTETPPTQVWDYNYKAPSDSA